MLYSHQHNYSLQVKFDFLIAQSEWANPNRTCMFCTRIYNFLLVEDIIQRKGCIKVARLSLGKG